MHKCITEEIRDYASRWIASERERVQKGDWLFLFPPVDIALLTNALSAPETAFCWESASAWSSKQPELGQYVLFESVIISLTYKPAQKTKGESTSWREEILDTVDKLESLILDTPQQHSKWQSHFAAIVAARIAERQACHIEVSALLEGRPPITMEEPDILGLQRSLETLLSPQAIVAEMEEALYASDFNQGPWPLRPNNPHAARTFFIRSLAGLLMPVTESWPDVTRNLALGIFADDLKRSQLIALTQGVYPKSHEVFRIAENYKKGELKTQAEVKSQFFTGQEIKR